MKISNNSWHWKLHNFFTEYPRLQYSLCTYFWLTVRNVLLALLMITVLSVIVAFIVSPFLVLFGLYEPSKFSTIGFCIDIVIIMLVAGVLSKVYWKETIKPKFFKDKPSTKTTNMVVEYVRAKKSNICPILEVE